MNSLLKQGFIVSRDSGKVGDLGASEWTYLFNITLYLTVKEYNSKNKSRLYIVPEKGGKLPTDFSLETSGRKEILFIEHENNPNRIKHNLKKLFKSRAENRLLVCYEDKSKLKARLKKLMKYKGRKITILIGPYDIQKVSEYKSLFL